MSDGNGQDRISVSRDALRAELATLELRLVSALASKAEVDRLSERVGMIELHGSPAMSLVKDEQNELAKQIAAIEVELRDRPQQVKEHDAMRSDVESLKGWRNRLIGGFLVVGVIAGATGGKLFGAF